MCAHGFCQLVHFACTSVICLFQWGLPGLLEKKIAGIQLKKSYRHSHSSQLSCLRIVEFNHLCLALAFNLYLLRACLVSLSRPKSPSPCLSLVLAPSLWLSLSLSLAHTSSSRSIVPYFLTRVILFLFCTSSLACSFWLAGSLAPFVYPGLILPPAFHSYIASCHTL